LRHLEEVPADRLLNALGLVVGLNANVGAVPEVVKLLALPALKAGDAGLRDPIQRLTAALDELGRGHDARRLIGDELRHPQRQPRRRLRVHDHRAAIGRRVGMHTVGKGRLDPVLDADAECHPAVAGSIPQQQTHPVDRATLLVQHPLARARRQPRVAGGLLGQQVIRVGVLAIKDLRGQHDRRRVLRKHHLVLDGRDVAVLQRHEPHGAHDHLLAPGRRPRELAREDARAHVQHSRVVAQARRRHEERLVVDVELDDRRVGDVDDRLSGAREPERLLGVEDPSGFVKPRDEGARRDRRPTLLERPTHADEAVGDGEDRFRAGVATLGETRLH
jgi:hypothetical protein